MEFLRPHGELELLLMNRQDAEIAEQIHKAIEPPGRYNRCPNEPNQSAYYCDRLGVRRVFAIAG
jgi:hypothetical protein